MPIQLWLVIKLFQGLGLAIQAMFRGLRILLAWLVTPRGHRQCGQFRQSRGAQEMHDDGYDVRADFARDAFASRDAL